MTFKKIYYLGKFCRSNQSCWIIRILTRNLKSYELKSAGWDGRRRNVELIIKIIKIYSCLKKTLRSYRRIATLDTVKRS